MKGDRFVVGPNIGNVVAGVYPRFQSPDTRTGIPESTPGIIPLNEPGNTIRIF